jgi:hypothetical protein
MVQPIKNILLCDTSYCNKPNAVSLAKTSYRGKSKASSCETEANHNHPLLKYILLQPIKSILLCDTLFCNQSKAASLAIHLTEANQKPRLMCNIILQPIKSRLSFDTTYFSIHPSMICHLSPQISTRSRISSNTMCLKRSSEG